MKYADRISLRQSTGKACFLCEEKIPKGELVTSVTIVVDLFLKKVLVTEEAHCRCAVQAAEQLAATAKRGIDAVCS